MSSQNGEDGILAAILDATGGRDGWFLEIGAGDGSEGNCLELARQGMRGLFVEADMARFQRLSARVDTRLTGTACWVVRSQHMPELCRREANLRCLSIDVDGHDYWLWAAVSDDVRPDVVVVEYNAALGPTAKLTKPFDDDTPWDGTDYFGASLNALCSLGASKGYDLVHVEASGTNAFFVPIEQRLLFRVPPGDLYRPARIPHPRDTSGRRYEEVP